MSYGLQQVFEESVSAVTATNTVELGTERWQDGVKCIYVYNKSTSTAAVKHGVVYSASSGYSVTVSCVAAAGTRCAGVVVHTELDPSDYGWIAVKGNVHVTSSGLSAIVQGDKIYMDGETGTFGRPTGGTGWTGHVAGEATGSTDTAGTFAAFINVG